MCKYLADGRRQIVDFALKGDFIGLAPYREHTLTAETASDTDIVAYSTRGLEHFSRESPSIGHWLTTKLTRELSRVQGHLVILGRQTGEERVATFLLMLAERSNAEEGDIIHLSMSRRDIADYLGLTIESVCRQLSAMKRRQAIYMPEVHKVFVKNMELLRGLATGEDAALASIARWA
jgi:CRP/FNR family nitrogen fixation transcriptional regulator